MNNDNFGGTRPHTHSPAVGTSLCHRKAHHASIKRASPYCVLPRRADPYRPLARPKNHSHKAKEPSGVRRPNMPHTHKAAPPRPYRAATAASRPQTPAPPLPSCTCCSCSILRLSTRQSSHAPCTNTAAPRCLRHRKATASAQRTQPLWRTGFSCYTNSSPITQIPSFYCILT